MLKTHLTAGLTVGSALPVGSDALLHAGGHQGCYSSVGGLSADLRPPAPAPVRACRVQALVLSPTRELATQTTTNVLAIGDHMSVQVRPLDAPRPPARPPAHPPACMLAGWLAGMLGLYVAIVTPSCHAGSPMRQVPSPPSAALLPVRAPPCPP